MSSTVQNQFARQIDGIKRTDEAYGSRTVAVYLADEAFSKRLCKIKIGSVSTDAQVYIVAFGRHIAVNVRLGFFSIVRYGVNVYLLLFFIPLCLGIKHTHSSVLELKLSDTQARVGLNVAENSAERDRS